jgi:hypothetical protein
MAKRLKASDIYKEVNYTRNQLRGLLDELGYTLESDGETQPRVARTYSPHDFLVILIACELETNYGLRRNAIASLIPYIASELSGPRSVTKQPKLVLSLNPVTVQYLDVDVNINSGFVLPLAEIFSRVDLHLQQTGNPLSLNQKALNFGPSLIQGNSSMVINSIEPTLRAKL